MCEKELNSWDYNLRLKFIGYFEIHRCRVVNILYFLGEV